MHTKIGKLLWLLVLLVVANSAYAMQCGTKKVYINIPSSWAGLWINVDGAFLAVPTTAIVNGWYVIDLNSYGSQYATKWFFSSSGGDWNANKITKAVYNALGDQNDAFTCTDIGANDAIYISENLAVPGTTEMGFAPPNAKYFYFLPPDESEWFQGTAMAIINGGAPVVMTADPTRCGWYKVTYFNVDPPTDLLLTLDIAPEDFLIGDEGVDAAADPIHINLKQKFDANTTGNEVYFVADEGTLGWYNSDPGVEHQCTYDLAAIIYDSDYRLHSAFSCDAYPNVATTACPGPATYMPGGAIPCIGVTKNMVQATLGADRKPIYNAASGCFASANDFSSLFLSTANVNTKVCRDLPFKRATDGLWEYDSYNEPQKGYYPVDDETGVGSTKISARGGVPYGVGDATTGINWASINPATGLPYIDTYPTVAGEFDNGKNPDVYDDTKWDLRTKGMHNEFFCFETHADFVLRAGQKFYFRGDDDIWVFINKKLVVDLGGMHLAAPGYVLLDTIQGVTAGNSYNIDVFFCDRRTDMSNVRIKTNMYFEQKKSLYWDRTPGTNTYVVSKLQSGGAGCSAMVDTAGTQIIPGSNLSLMYMLISTRGDTIDGDPTTANIKEPNLVEGRTIYGGITISNGSVTVDSSKMTGLAPGRYRLTIYEASNPSVKATILIKIAGNTAFWSVNGKLDAASIAATPAVDTLAGRLVPFEIAKKSGDFVDSSDASFMLGIPDGLLVYYDSLGLSPVGNGVSVSTGADGIIKLWATGTRKSVADTATYALTLKGSKAPPVYLKFHMPRLAFVADSTSGIPIPGNATDSLGKEVGYFAFINIPTYLIAFDPKSGELCFDCNDTLAATSVDSLAFASPAGGATLYLTNGRGVVFVRGTGAVVNGSFIVQGPTPLMVVGWTEIHLERPPIPVPNFAAMYDRNSDGIADSLYVSFDRSVLDTMPDFLVIRWPSESPDTTIIEGKSRVLLTPDTALQKLFPTTSSNEVAALLSADGLGFGYSYTYDQINTKSLGELDAWFSFSKNGQVFQRPVVATIQDKMSPIIARARIKIAKDAAVWDTLRISMSEPVDTTGMAGATPFEFRLLSTTDGLTPSTVTATVQRWNASMDTVWLLYGKDALHPRAGDSARITITGTYQMMDKQGNLRSISNPFVIIEGDKRNEVVTIDYVNIDPNSPVITARLTQNPTFITKVGVYDDIEKIKTTLLTNYGPVLGHVIKTDLSEIYTKYAAAYPTLQPSDIVLHYETGYYTNLGGYVAKASGTVACTDTTIFGKDPRGCTGPSNGYVFIGWNLTSDQHRLVASGAYVARLRSWVTVPKFGKAEGTSLSEDKIWGVLRQKK